MQSRLSMETLRFAGILVTALVMASCSSENTGLEGASGGLSSGTGSGPASSSGGSSSGGSSSGGSSSGGSSSGGSSSGGSSSGGSSSGGSSSGGVDAGHDSGGGDASNCIPAVPSPGSGHHNAGEDCLSCHANLSASVRWTVAGTLYSAATGGTAVSGATIEVTDASGKVLKLATYNNGNFYTTTAVKFPLQVRASKCPADMAMTGSVPQGSCNTGGCHTSAMRIHLP